MADNGERNRVRQNDLLFLLSVVAAGLALRLDFLIHSGFVVDADEAIVGLMGKHIAEGAPWPVFYYGQHYMGSLEALCAAVVFRLFGPSSAALKTVPLFFSLVLIVLVYLLARQIGNRFTARAAALLTALSPASLTVWSAKARGGFIELIVIGALALLITCHWLRSPHLIRTAVIGLLLGLGWWVNNQILYFMVPIALAMLSVLVREGGAGPARRALDITRHTGVGLAAFLLGGLPFWLYNLRHDFVSFGLFEAGRGGEIAAHVAGLFTTALPMIVGARLFWHDREIFPGAIWLSGLLYGAALLLVLWPRRRELLRCFLLHIDRQQPVELFLLFLAATFVIFSVSAFGYLVQAPRYLLPAFAVLYAVVAFAVDVLYRRNRAAGLLLLVSFAALNLASNYLHGRAIPGEPFVYANQRVARDHSRLIAWLDRHGYRWVRTNYWIGYRLAFETGERVKFSMFQAPYQIRMPEYERAAGAVPGSEMPMILVPQQAQIVEQAFDAMGMSYERDRVPGYVVLHNIAPSQRALRAMPRELVEVSASFNQDQARQAIDGSVKTRWGSGRPQNAEMMFELTLKEPSEVRALVYQLGGWTHDFPRRLTIEAEDVTGSRTTLLDSHQYTAVSYYLTGLSSYPMYFKLPRPIRKILLSQTGSDPYFDWSIAEIELYR